MKNPTSSWVMALFFLYTLLVPVPVLATGTLATSQKWLQRHWEIRYVLLVEEASTMRSGVVQSRKFNAEQRALGKQKNYLSARALFEPNGTFVVPDARTLGVVVLAFDSMGKIINQNGLLGKMTARLTRLYEFDLVENTTHEPDAYHFAYWAQGIPGDVTFSPAVCSAEDHRRYVAGWDVDNYVGNFGCREWTAQLYDRDQPYIDVTTYASRGNYIGTLTGWSRFEDPPKPVIGRHGKTWLCLHECPAGEKPGVIPDIRAWTTRHGYPMPVRPAKQPLYPNADYMDDLNEFWQQ
jgi:hypothetical protein